MIDKRILIIGGTGFVGRSVAKGLLAAGFQVRLLARNPHHARKAFGENVDIVSGDVTIPDSLLPAMKDCDGVFVSLHGGRGKENFFRIEHRGVENVAKAAAEAGVKHIVMISGANVCRDESVYFVHAKYLGEQALLDNPIPATILRCSWFMESLPLMVKGPMAVVIGRQPHPIHFIALKDLVRMVAKAFATPEAGNKTFQAYGPESCSVHEALKKYCQAFAPWAPIVHMPLSAFWLISRIAGGRLPFVHDLMALLNKYPEPTDCGDATEILGSNPTTLEQWIKEKQGNRNDP